ncbi:MAG: ABC transporter permease subunit, partial [Cypionkella sp.]|nr:ABC transporter permease subunit [Cypionkella sp.]
LQLGVVSIIAGLVLGLALALMRLYAPVWVQVLAKIYINFMRSIPLLVLLIIIYHALPFVGIRLSPFMSAVSALSLVSAAHTAEIFHAGIAAIAKVGSRALPRWASTALGAWSWRPEPSPSWRAGVPGTDRSAAAGSASPGRATVPLAQAVRLRLQALAVQSTQGCRRNRGHRGSHR